MEQSHRRDVEQADVQVVQRVQRGDVQAYGELVERYERGVLAVVWPIVRDGHSARDVVQDAFVQAFLSIQSLRDGSRFGPWLLKAAQREALRAARRSRRKPMRLAETEPAVQEDARLLDDERQQLLNRVRCLPAHERAVVTLRYFDGRSVQEIARLTSRPVGTVTKQLSRALRRLRDDLGTESESCQTSRSMIA